LFNQKANRPTTRSQKYQALEEEEIDEQMSI